MLNEKWEQQKNMLEPSFQRRKRMLFIENAKSTWNQFFGFLKANLGFTRFSVRGKSRIASEMGLALLAVNLRKFTASS